MPNNPSRYESQDKFSVRRQDLVATRCTDDGTPTGAANLAANFSVTPGNFFCPVPPGVKWHIERVIVYMTGPGNAFANNYGPISALSVGTVLGFEDALGASIMPPLTLLVKSNGEFQEFQFQQSPILDAGPGDVHVTFTQIFQETFGSNVVLHPGERFSARPNDDLSGLTSHFVGLGGYQLALL